jgi:N-methylhydantoinase B
VLANTRTPGEREGDVRAQLAAHRLAERRLAEVAARHGAGRVREAFAALLGYAERRTRAAIAEMPDGRYEAAEALEGDGVDDGDLWIRVAVTIAGDRMTVDFTGSDPAGPGNSNCPPAVTRSAVYFVVRALTDPDIPASAGAFAPVEVVAPAGSLVSALPPAAVAGGNVETSSRIVDAVMSALGGAVDVPAQGQGTMNNVTVGGPAFTYYETIGGGQGASPGADGPSGVHVAMSNTLNTPVEALETAYPLRVESYRLRRGTGGAGAHRGGDGVERRLRALEDCEASVIAERRRRGPAGRRGGADGAPEVARPPAPRGRAGHRDAGRRGARRAPRLTAFSSPAAPPGRRSPGSRCCSHTRGSGRGPGSRAAARRRSRGWCSEGRPPRSPPHTPGSAPGGNGRSSHAPRCGRTGTHRPGAATA